MSTHSPFISVEGPIGVGKTSLANRLADYYNYPLLCEMYEENPFLARFYENIEEWSFQTEMFFLSTRYKQLEDITRTHIDQHHPVVADYHIFKNLIFSKMTLSEQQYEKYHAIYNILVANMPQPNVVVYLRASLDTLVHRVTQRGRGFEKTMSHDYLRALSADYDHFIREFQLAHPEVRVLIFNGDEIDFVNRDADFHFITEQLDKVLLPYKNSYKAI